MPRFPQNKQLRTYVRIPVRKPKESNENERRIQKWTNWGRSPVRSDRLRRPQRDQTVSDKGQFSRRLYSPWNGATRGRNVHFQEGKPTGKGEKTRRVAHEKEKTTKEGQDEGGGETEEQETRKAVIFW